MKWHYAATTKAVYVFNIWYRCCYFHISRYCAAFLKAVIFIGLNSLVAYIAEKQQSDEKLLATKLSEEQCHRRQGKFQFSP